MDGPDKWNLDTFIETVTTEITMLPASRTSGKTRPRLLGPPPQSKGRTTGNVKNVQQNDKNTHQNDYQQVYTSNPSTYSMVSRNQPPKDDQDVQMVEEIIQKISKDASK